MVVTVKDVDPITGGEIWPVAERLLVQPQERIIIDDPLFPIELEWTDTRARVPPAVGSDSEPCLRCCVVCGGEVICACRVQSPCGDCCCRDTCGCDIVG